MANILEQYGIKEVADVTLYEIDTDVNGLVTYTPALFLDTLKVSTIEQTAEQVDATGGKGNSPLLIWDYGKEITVNLEDALFTPASLAIMFGDDEIGNEATGTVTRMERTTVTTEIKALTEQPVDMTYYSGLDMSELANEDFAGLTVGQTIYVEKTVAASNINTIEVSAATFPGTYKLVGDTYARNKKTGKDEYFQFIIPQAKMGSENTITLEAEGDPTVFSMTMRVLRPTDGKMMKLVQYNISE